MTDLPRLLFHPEACDTRPSHPIVSLCLENFSRRKMSGVRHSDLISKEKRKHREKHTHGFKAHSPGLTGSPTNKRGSSLMLCLMTELQLN